MTGLRGTLPEMARRNRSARSRTRLSEYSVPRDGHFTRSGPLPESTRRRVASHCSRVRSWLGPEQEILPRRRAVHKTERTVRVSKLNFPSVVTINLINYPKVRRRHLDQTCISGTRYLVEVDVLTGSGNFVSGVPNRHIFSQLKCN
jgi:hypothetical protein